MLSKQSLTGPIITKVGAKKPIRFPTENAPVHIPDASAVSDKGNQRSETTPGLTNKNMFEMAAKIWPINDKENNDGFTIHFDGVTIVL